MRAKARRCGRYWMISVAISVAMLFLLFLQHGPASVAPPGRYRQTRSGATRAIRCGNGKVRYRGKPLITELSRRDTPPISGDPSYFRRTWHPSVLTYCWRNECRNAALGDILIKRLQCHAKQAWMLRSYMQ